MNQVNYWKITIAGSVIGLFYLIITWLFAESAPQQAAGAGIAAACAVVPYCFARAMSELNAGKEEKK